MVFRAWDTRLARYVALKLLAPAAPSVGAQALAEARLLARVRHPNIVTIHGADSIDGRVGLWMELIDGRTLERRLDDDGTLSATEAVAVGLDFCAALSAVHAAGLLHRDVKTQNVMRERGGRIVLMDFSAGHTLIPDATSPSPLTGTAMLMAPELFRGKRPTPGSDVYSLGVVLFRLLTGRFPIDASTVAEVKAAHVAGAYRNLAGLRAGLPEHLAGAIARAIHPDPAVRFDSADTFADALRASLGDPTRASRKRRRYSWQHLALATTVATGLVTAGWLAATSATRREPAGRAPGLSAPSTLPRRRCSSRCGTWSGSGSRKDAGARFRPSCRRNARSTARAWIPTARPPTRPTQAPPTPICWRATPWRTSRSR